MSSNIRSLPEDVVVDILARVPVCDYPKVSIVSKYFRSLVSSPEIYARRSSLGCTEHCLCVVLYDRDNCVDRLYTLHRKEKEKDKGLVLIPGLPDMPIGIGGRFAAVGSKIYAFGWINSFSIDCTSHTVQPLPGMPVPLYYTVADVIGGRIYVFGFIVSTDQNWYAMLVFDTETQMWEDGMTKPVVEAFDGCLVVIDDKIYMRDYEKSFVYDPKESKWETEEVLDSKEWKNACVVDDVLYFYADFDQELKAYDPQHKCWTVVKGLDDLFAEMRRGCCCLARTVSYAGKLVLFFYKQETIREICCAEVLLERRKGSQIWGEVDQRSDHALIAGNFRITKSLDVVL